mgnify:CR=1 FL=1
MSSNVWKYFVKSPKSSPSSKIGGQCKLCFQHVKTSGNSTNLINHLKRKHPDIDILKSNETLETELTEKRKKPQLVILQFLQFKKCNFAYLYMMKTTVLWNMTQT